MHDKRGIALIFNHEKFIVHSERTGTRKDGRDLKTVLETLNFEVKYYLDLKLVEIKNILREGKTQLLKYEHKFISFFDFSF